ADAAMYRAKEQGRGGYALFQEQLHQRSMAHLTLDQEMRRGLARGEFSLAYQPVVALGTQEVVGAEALVRWRHPERGLVMPADFIPLAEETGFIVSLGQWVYCEALAQVQAWDARSDAPHLGAIAVNVSGQQLKEKRLSQQRREFRRAHQIAGSRVCIELTERVAMDPGEVTRDTLVAMREDGLNVAIDDFGTGYSSLAYLRSLPVTALKIDRQFVMGIGTTADAEAVVAAIIDMAHHLGLIVVAEGVETETQRDALLRLGCDLAQGYMWSPPLDAEAFCAWTAQHVGADLHVQAQFN
ncbi:MAG TPA: EAL domain-containing protein, partial [Acidimicrobiales bacterium]|nr:EAL domain-containing protein [Acidimicrobiales bacterium]